MKKMSIETTKKPKWGNVEFSEFIVKAAKAFEEGEKSTLEEMLENEVNAVNCTGMWTALRLMLITQIKSLEK